eukprot:Gregarina_sp_Pseudo_9__1794@NODE_221_length_3552_cov_20_581554_g206_i0_p1_GENE_NODE_221_length_3552_cov_20_581554_g206_i0NODE_221_length_3552_cov_20_581554_g206_i0_p1_ORF_typecomplete_len274_score69_25EI24/PF07264_11/3_9e07TMEM240/PF15207_6/0_22TMEM240/PF15207_6/2_4e03DUF3159/PF11361_8/0_11DUF3159/PF11361_8/1_1e03_NODE_221_length_3552_cov_20_581554_g206_i025983419
MSPLVLLLQSLFYCVRYREVLLRPNWIYFAGFVLIHLLISRPIIAVVVGWERVFIDEVIYGSLPSWRTSDMTVRFLRWSQTKWLTFFLARELRRSWRRHFKSALVEIEGLRAQGVSLSYKKPLKDHAGGTVPGRLRYYISLSWFSAVSSPLTLRLCLLLLSTPIHALPYIGTWLYVYIHAGIKARRICAEFSHTQGGWNRLQRSRFCAQTASQLRLFACLLELLEDCPLGCAVSPVLDLSVLLWMCQLKALDQVKSLTIDKIENRPAMKALQL